MVLLDKVKTEPYSGMWYQFGFVCLHVKIEGE